jgi:PhnB protein
MKLVNNLVFKGNCREAFERYADVLGGEIKAMFAFGDAPDGMPVDEQNRDMIMHAWLQIGDQAIMGCDAPPAYQQEMGGFSVAFHSDDAQEAKRVFDGLVEGGKTVMPFGSTFWSPAFGMLTDRFGTPWIVNTTPPEGWTPDGA